MGIARPPKANSALATMGIARASSAPATANVVQGSSASEPEICLPWVPSDRAGQGAVDIAAGRTGEAEAISERICATRQDVATTPEKSHSHRSSAGRTRLVKAHV